MQVPIGQIKVKQRVRKDIGDIEALAASMSTFGQLHPIIIGRRNELIAGGRRLAAAKKLGWKTINAVVVDVPDKGGRLELELEENVQRTALSFLELEEGYARLGRLQHPGFLGRIWNAIRNFFRKIFHRS